MVVRTFVVVDVFVVMDVEVKFDVQPCSPSLNCFLLFSKLAEISPEIIRREAHRVNEYPL
jgi:hypothetical protein